MIKVNYLRNKKLLSLCVCMGGLDLLKFIVISLTSKQLYK